MHRPHLRQSARRPTFWAALAVVLLLVGGGALWNNVIRHRLFPKNFGVVEAGHIYRSGYLQPGMLRQVVAEQQLKTIIDLGGSEPGSARRRAEIDTAESLGVQRFQFELTGEEDDDPAVYAQVLRLMADEANHPLLVHCAAGADRTTAAVLLYEHVVKGGDLADTLAKSIREHRHEPADNPGLLAYVIKHVETIRQHYQAATDVEALEQAPPTDEG